jgi:DNA-binding GntR family transcriptional regulator
MTLAACTFERLRSDLKANRFKPGERLAFSEMRAAYGVGVAPLREALSRLSETGLVVQLQQKGFRVAQASLEDLADIVDTRRFLEIRALEAALANPDDSWEGELAAAFHRFSKLSRLRPETTAERATWEESHTTLHHAFVAGCPNRWLLHFWATVFDQAERYRRLTLQTGRWAEEISDHEAIVNAILNRDADKAVALLGAHIGHSAESLITRLKDVLPT